MNGDIIRILNTVNDPQIRFIHSLVRSLKEITRKLIGMIMKLYPLIGNSFIIYDMVNSDIIIGLHQEM